MPGKDKVSLEHLIRPESKEELRKGLGCGDGPGPHQRECPVTRLKNLSSEIMQAFYHNPEKKHPECILLLLAE